MTGLIRQVSFTPFLLLSARRPSVLSAVLRCGERLLPFAFLVAASFIIIIFFKFASLSPRICVFLLALLLRLLVCTVSKDTFPPYRTRNAVML